MPDAKTDMTEVPSLLMKIRPTPLERAMGRLMRAPDHDAGDAGDASGGDAGSGDAGAGDGGDGDQVGADGKSGEGDGGGSDEATVLGEADAGSGAGDGDDAGKKDAGDGEGDQSKDGAEGLPEKYTIDNLPEGVELDQELLDEATPTFKELGLGNEQVSKLAPLAIKVQERIVQKQADTFAAMRADWAKEAQADEDIGGKNWKQTQALAARALDHYGAGRGSEFRGLLDDTGLGNHPVMIRLFRDVGRDLSEDGTFARGDAKAPKKSREEELYPEDVPKK